MIVWQIRHGLSCESHAKVKYTNIMKKHHQKFTSKDPGMTIMQSDPYISATPDLEINCQCHGEGLVEIKCPPSVPFGETPNNNNYKHLSLNKVTKKVELDKRSEYYYQIQGQLGVTGRKYTDFFVFTMHGGFHLERIMFDESFWLRLKENLTDFWSTFILPELLLVRIDRPKRILSEESRDLLTIDEIEFDTIFESELHIEYINT